MITCFHFILGIDCFMPANGETATIPVITKVTIEVSKSLLAKRKMADGDGKILELSYQHSILHMLCYDLCLLLLSVVCFVLKPRQLLVRILRSFGSQKMKTSFRISQLDLNALRRNHIKTFYNTTMIVLIVKGTQGECQC